MNKTRRHTTFRHPHPRRVLFTARDLFALMAPLAVEQALVMLVSVVDVAMISNVSEAAVSAVSLVDMLTYFFIVLFAALSAGGAVVASQYLGAQRPAEASRAAGQLIGLAFLFGMGLGAVILVAEEPLLALLFGQVEAAVWDAAWLYLLFTIASLPFLALYDGAAAVFRSMNKTSVTMYVSLAANGVNVIGNALGVFVFQAGILGVAVPTLIARAFSAVVILALLRRPALPVCVRLRDTLQLKAAMVRRILTIAVPGAIENGTFAFGKVVVVAIVALFGTTQMAANGVADSIEKLAVLVVTANNLAVITVAGQYLGAGDTAGARFGVRQVMRASFVATAVLGLGEIALLPALRPLFAVTDATWSLSCVLIVTHNLMAIALHPASFNLANALRAAGDVTFTMVVGIASLIICRLGTAYLLGVVASWGIYGVWLGMGADWLARSVAFGLRWRSHAWESRKVIEDTPRGEKTLSNHSPTAAQPPCSSNLTSQEFTAETQPISMASS
ncbi:MATE family efflux transporter [Adlercreutzia equolifaciens]|uniref:MATE family efflux transporter n=1 Tax=Adlercreutzia equolifaciens TaxID=446660 RepID=UPI0023B01262|nr:MATE family efflux transporter [Adlercreutzia equolifaciens]MDE8702688.1 MATE family efflux transporter [Adlercreutzia equolifaciens]